MKARYIKSTIIPAITLLFWVSAQAEQQPPAAQNLPAPASSPLGGSTTDGKAADTAKGKAADIGGMGKDAPVEESPTLNMKVPLFNPAFAKMPVAEVNDDGILVEDLLGAIASMHQGIEEQKTSARKSYTDLLNRLINIKLMVQEARNIELDQLPEIKNLVSQFEKATLREILFSGRTKDVKPEENEVEKLYRERIKEWKITTIKFAKEEDAKKLEKDIKGGGSFDLLIDRALKDGLAQGGKESVTLRAAEANPLIAKAIADMKTGAVSPVLPVDAGYAVFRLDEVVFPENADARKQAWRDVYSRAKQQELNRFRGELFKKYVVINSRLLKELDFEAPKPGFKKLLDDKRTVATIKGEKPVTVSDLAHALKDKFFHGIDAPIKEKKVNVLKADMLNQVIAKNIVIKEALQQGIDKSDNYLQKVKDYKETVLFGTFIENVVRRDVKVTENDAMDYYGEHLKEYTYPAMVRMFGIAFKTMEGAQSCVDKLRQGVDYKWLKETSDGQLAEDTPGLQKFGGELLAMTSLPEDLRKALAGVHSDDYRLYKDAGGHFHALQIKEYIPPKEMPYPEARDTVIRKVYDENLKKIMAEWTKKLRDASDVKIYADFGEIR